MDINKLPDKYKISIFILIVIVLITMILHFWFAQGLLISNNSEENLNIYNAQLSSSYYSHIWDPLGTGAKMTFYLSRYPTFYLLAQLQSIGIPTYITQTILIGITMFIGIIGLFFFSKKIINFSYLQSVLASLFYFLNLYTLTQVWKRFLYNQMIAWAFFPIFLLGWIKWSTT